MKKPADRFVPGVEQGKELNMRGTLLLAWAFCLVIDEMPNGLASTEAGNALSDKEIRDCYANSFRYEKAQNYDDAIKALLLVYDSHPQLYTVNLRLGWLYYLRSNHANSRKHYQVAVMSSPSSIEARLGYMLPLLAQERYRETETIARLVIGVDYRNYYAKLRLAFALRMQKKYAQAENVVNEMLRYYPSDVSFLCELGFLKAARNQNDEAKRLFREVLMLDPENVTAIQQLSRL